MSHRWKITLRIATTLLCTLFIVGLVAVGYVYYTLTNTIHGTESTGNLPLHEDKTDAQTILLVGTDAREDAHGNPLPDDMAQAIHAGNNTDFINTDVLILLRLPYDGKPARAISIPRDTYVSTGAGNMKINGVYAAAMSKAHQAGEDKEGTEDEGRKALISTVERLTGAQINHYAEVGFVGFIDGVDAVGGAPVCLNHAVNDEEYSGAVFPAGEQTLGGVDALKFVRQRHGLPRGDLDRVARQQALLGGVAQQLSGAALANPILMHRLSGVVQDAVVLDPGWSLFDAVRKFYTASKTVEFSTIPVTSMNGRGDKGESVVTIDPGAVREFVTGQLDESNSSDGENNTQAAPNYNNAHVEVVQGGKDAAKPKDVKNILAQSHADTGNTVYTLYGVTGQRSEVVAAQEGNPVALQVAQQLGGLPVSVDTSLQEGTVRVIISDSYQGPRTLHSHEDTGGEGVSDMPVVGEVGDSGELRSGVFSSDAQRCVD